MRLLLLLALVACKDRPQTTAPEPAPVVATADAAARKPPAKTSVPHTAAQLDALAKLDVAGYAKTVLKLDPSFLDVRHHSDTLAVRVTIQPCLKCAPLDVDRWRADKDALMITLAPELRDRPDTTFEIGGADKLIYVYQLGHAASDDLGTAFSNAYILYHHDGVNQIRVIAEALHARTSKAELARAVPRDQLEQAATTILDAYVQAWGN
jgi:hypothetical protein